MRTNHPAFDELSAHLKDLREKSDRWHTHTVSSFMNEEEVAEMQRIFPASKYVIYDGGYEGARKQKVIFRYDEEDDFSDIVCLRARIDQRFRKITHRDVLGALMHLQIDRSSFGDFWIEDTCIYLYTSEEMAPFLCGELTRINQLNVSFEVIADRPVQQFHMKELHVVVASERLDALVAGLCHISRAQAKELIHGGLVSLNHIVLEHPDYVCNNNGTISIRGYGRFLYLGYERVTKTGRIVAICQQYV